MGALTAHTKKSDNFTDQKCPACQNNFRILKGQPIDLPDACPICQDKAHPADNPGDNTLVMNSRTLQKMQAQVVNLDHRVRSLEGDLKAILVILGREDTALNDDVPDSTKQISQPQA